MFTVAIPTPAEIVAEAARATASGIGLASARAFAVVTGARQPHVVGHQGCTCGLGRRGLWCVHRSLYAVAFGQVEPPRRPPAPIVPFVPRRQHTDRYPRPLRPAPIVPFRPRRPAA